MIQKLQQRRLKSTRKSKIPYAQLDVYGNEVYKMTYTEIKTAFWTPEKKGDEIVGKVIDVIDGNFGKQYLIKIDNGNMITTPSHVVLQAKMINVKEGEKVKIIFDGEIPATKKGNNPTKIYNVFVDR